LGEEDEDTELGGAKYFWNLICC